MKYRSIFISIVLGFSMQAFANVEEFKDPRVEGLRMDRCLTWAKDCDKPAAYNWCLEKGYTKAIYWEIESNVGKTQPTKMMKSKGICNKPGCDAFKTIVCYSNV